MSIKGIAINSFAALMVGGAAFNEIKDAVKVIPLSTRRGGRGEVLTWYSPSCALTSLPSTARSGRP